MAGREGGIGSELDRRLWALIILAIVGGPAASSFVGTQMGSSQGVQGVTIEQVRDVVQEAVREAVDSHGHESLSYGQRDQIELFVDRRVKPIERNVDRLNDAVFAPRRNGASILPDAADRQAERGTGG